MMLDVIRIDTERTGQTRTESDWAQQVMHLQNSMTRAESIALQLARTALALNGWSTDMPVEISNHFHATIQTLGYGV